MKQEVVQTLQLGDQTYTYASLQRLAEQHPEVKSLPYAIRALLESALRQWDGVYITDEHIQHYTNWQTSQNEQVEVPFKPSRIVLQDFTGVPAIVDLASLRQSVSEMNGAYETIHPRIAVDLVVDHSVIIEESGFEGAFARNLNIEYERNLERYRFIKWAQKAFQKFRVVPPANGIVHQVNLEYLGSSVVAQDGELYLDTVVGTDSHTPMINGLGTIGWGVGGIEAEAAMLGHPIYFVLPEVIGVHVTGKLSEGVLATDLALTLTERLRKENVVGKIVEFYGEGLDHLPLADRATISNMAPEYGATMSFFPTDDETIRYLRETNREEEAVLSEAYHRANLLYRTGDVPNYTKTIELDLAEIETSLAGPKRPQDRVALRHVHTRFNTLLKEDVVRGGYGVTSLESKSDVKHGDVVLASITSCTNTSNPSVMLAAGLVAQKAVQLGLSVPDYVKTSLVPGSTVVTRYLQESGVLESLEQLGFYVDGYGCGACCGNSGALDSDVARAITENDLVTSSVISGNRNFEGRVHPLVKANFLASPPLVVAYALLGNTREDITQAIFGKYADGTSITLADLWPTAEEIARYVETYVHEHLFETQYEHIFDNERWDEIEAPEGMLFEWEEMSSYIQPVPFFKKVERRDTLTLEGMRPLLILGDSITTDHISPVGTISKGTPAARYLEAQGVNPKDFNSYGSRRGNYHVMVRGTFANIRLRNQLVSREGGWTRHIPTGEVLPVFEAAERYQKEQTSLLVIAGKEYGTGSSRDWAAKGTNLLGIRIVLAESFERIHRSNLIGMGVLPLQFLEGENAETHQLTGEEIYRCPIDFKAVKPRDYVQLHIDDRVIDVILRLDSEVEMNYYRNGGILPTVLDEYMD